MSAFPLLDRFARGDDIAPFITTFSSLGYNLLRVWPYVPTKDWGTRAWDWPASFDTLLDFLAVCRAFGFQVELTLLTDDEPTRADQAGAALRVLRAANPDNLLLEIQNEPGIGKHDVTEWLRASCQASGFLFSSGQYQDPPRHFGNFLTDHSPRDDQWARKAKNALEFYDGGGPWNPTDPPHHCPIVEDEPMRPDQTPGATRYLDYRAYGGLCGMFAAGATFHYEGGKWGQLPNDDERRCAAELSAGLDAFPADAPLGVYRRIAEKINPAGSDDDLDNFRTLRTYVMSNCMVRVRPKVTSAPESGWRPVDGDGILWTR